MYKIEHTKYALLDFVKIFKEQAHGEKSRI